MFKRPENPDYIKPTVDCGEGLTKQSMKDETDINLIMKRYIKTGMVNFVNRNQAQYMEAPEIDFQTAMEVVTEANNTFSEMPAELRKRFSNDPGVFMDFVHDSANVEEMIALGLAERPEGYKHTLPAETAEKSSPDDKSA